MIAHHQGAIDMANVVLKTGDNAEMKTWLQKNAKKEGNQ